MVEVRTVLGYRGCWNCGRSFLVVLAEGMPLSLVGGALVDRVSNNNLRYRKMDDGSHCWMNVCPICNSVHDEGRLHRDAVEGVLRSRLMESIDVDIRCKFCGVVVDNILAGDPVCESCLGRMDYVDRWSLLLEKVNLAIDELRMVRDVISLGMKGVRDRRKAPKEALDEAMSILDRKVSDLLRRQEAIKAEMRASEPNQLVLVDEDLAPQVQGSMDIHAWLRLVRQDRPRAFVPWGSEEDVQLVRMNSTGMTIRDMASILHRTEGEVADRSSQPHPSSTTVVVGIE